MIVSGVRLSFRILILLAVYFVIADARTCYKTVTCSDAMTRPPVVRLYDSSFIQHPPLHTCHQSYGKDLIKFRGGSILSGWNPFGYGLTELGTQFLSFEGSLDCDVGRFLAAFKSGRKRSSVLKDQWLEIVRVSKSGQSMRIYRLLDDLLQFCIQAGFLS